MIVSSPLLYYFLIKIVWYGFSRYCEKQADMIAAGTVGAEGGIQFFEKFANPTQQTKWFDTHPSPQERLDYLKVL